MLKKLTMLYLYTNIVLIILSFHTFLPDAVSVDRYAITIWVILFFISILPTLVSSRVSYLFEFKRDLKRAVRKSAGGKPETDLGGRS